jgi:hypothetical protein
MEVSRAEESRVRAASELGLAEGLPEVFAQM